MWFSTKCGSILPAKVKKIIWIGTSWVDYGGSLLPSLFCAVIFVNQHDIAYTKNQWYKCTEGAFISLQKMTLIVVVDTVKKKKKKSKQTRWRRWAWRNMKNILWQMPISPPGRGVEHWRSVDFKTSWNSIKCRTSTKLSQRLCSFGGCRTF